MGSSKRKSSANRTQPVDYSSFLDTVEIGIVPGIRIPMKRLRTEEGRQEAERLRREWLRQNRNPLDYVRPETVEVREHICDRLRSSFKLDAQVFLYVIARNSLINST
jgi:hypothetical protein